MRIAGDNDMSALRVGVVPYLNARPLTYGLEHRPEIALISDVPSALVERLRADALDVALVSSVELFENPRYRMIPGLGVASRGPVESVLLFGHVAAPQARSLSLDTSSRTGVALARLVLERFHRCPPLRLRHDPPTADAAAFPADYVLRIGDPALTTPRDPFAHVLDLGEEWTRHTGLPFVYAVWIVRPGAPLGGREHLFTQARDAGRAALPAIAAAAALELELPYARVLHYLEHSVHHDLGPDHTQALDLFRESLKTVSRTIPREARADARSVDTHQD
jgi:chorismate dehydratase